MNRQRDASSRSVKFRQKPDDSNARNELITIPGGKHGGFTAEERVRAYIAIRKFLAGYGLPTGIEAVQAGR